MTINYVQPSRAVNISEVLSNFSFFPHCLTTIRRILNTNKQKIYTSINTRTTMYWILVVKDHRSADKRDISALEVLNNRVKYGFWSISSKNPYVKKINPGDIGVFLATGREARVFAGECTVTSKPMPLDLAHKKLLEGYPSTLSDSYFTIDGKLWEKPKEAEKAAAKLSFIKNKSKWYAYFQGTLKPIPQTDYEALKTL